MAAKIREIGHFGKVFYLSLSWLEAAYRDKVWVIDADHETTRLLLFGDDELCNQFQEQCAEMCYNTKDPDKEWRKW